jgi:hypothetical protein
LYFLASVFLINITSLLVGVKNLQSVLKPRLDALEDFIHLRGFQLGDLNEDTNFLIREGRHLEEPDGLQQGSHILLNLIGRFARE